MFVVFVVVKKYQLCILLYADLGICIHDAHHPRSRRLSLICHFLIFSYCIDLILISMHSIQTKTKQIIIIIKQMSSNNALSLSDMDATYFELEQAALERSLQSYSQKEDGKKQRASTPFSSTSLSSTATTPTPTTTTTDGSSKPNRIIKGDHKAPAAAAAVATAAAVLLSSATASLPCPSQESIPLAASSSVAAASIPAAATAASSLSVASTSTAASASAAAARRTRSESPPQLLPVEEYPSSVQELVMNGFSLGSVVKAYDLVGNNFDDMLSLCLANNTNMNMS